jgi:hypothetical protein
MTMRILLVLLLTVTCHVPALADQQEARQQARDLTEARQRVDARLDEARMRLG